ncbi:MAG: SDR family NAD(P)-dependent oxidoreductase [Bacillota bacterium]
MSDRHSLVTGAGSGIGRAIALRLAQEGPVSVVDVVPERASAIAQEIQSLGGKAVAVPGDISLRPGARKVIQGAMEALGPVHILVNNAGIYPAGDFLDISDEEWDRVMDVNVKAVLYCSQLVLREMIDKGIHGSVVNIASCDGKKPGPRITAYSASKAVVISMTRSMAAEMVEYGIRVNAVAPGWVGTPNILSGERWKDAIKIIPMGRLAEPEEIADAVAFLASDDARYIVGETLNVNGGLLMD